MYVDMIRAPARRPVREVLELGSGGGNNAAHMKRGFDMTLVEPSDRMRENSRQLNPECEHLPGDMRHVRLGRTFDAVFLHDAVMYMTTEDDLRAALETIAVHLAPDGVALVAPDATRETFRRPRSTAVVRTRREGRRVTWSGGYRQSPAGPPTPCITRSCYAMSTEQCASSTTFTARACSHVQRG